MTAIETVQMTKPAAEKLTLAIRAHGAKLGQLLHEAYDGQAWAALGYRSWSAYVEAELPFSRATSYRYLSAAPEQDALVAGGELSHGETNNSSNGQVVTGRDVDERPLDTITPDAILPPPIATASRKASGGARGTAVPPPPTGGPPPPPPAPPDPRTDPIRELVDDLQAVTTVDLRAYNGPWRVVLETEVRRAAEALGIMRRQGTVTRPADRATTRGQSSGTLTRREVEPMFKGAK